MKKGAKFNMLKNVKTHGGLVKMIQHFSFFRKLECFKLKIKSRLFNSLIWVNVFSVSELLFMFLMFHTVSMFLFCLRPPLKND